MKKQAQGYTRRKAEAIEKIMRISLGAAGVGAGLGGLVGLKRMFTSPSAGELGLATPAILPFKHIRRKHEEDRLAKVASDVGAAASRNPDREKQAEEPGLLQSLSEKIAPHIPDWETSSPALTSWWGLPALGLGIGGAGYGAYKLTNMLTGGIAAAKRKRQLERSKKEYEDALSDQYTSGRAKFSSFNMGGLFEKAAKIPSMSEALQAGKDVGGFGVGAYLSLLGLIGTGAGKMTYDWTKAHSRRDAARRALADERRKRMRQAPRPLLALPPEVTEG